MRQNSLLAAQESAWESTLGALLSSSILTYDLRAHKVLGQFSLMAACHTAASNGRLLSLSSWGLPLTVLPEHREG